MLNFWFAGLGNEAVSLMQIRQLTKVSQMWHSPPPLPLSVRPDVAVWRCIRK